MKKLLSSLLCILLIASLTSCSPTEKVPIEGSTGIDLYTKFIDNVSSGELHKLYYSFHSWYEFCTSTSTRIIFKEDSQGKRELLYRERNPFVFWYVPTYDYYDGTTYYYKYVNEWYTDKFTKYDRVQKADFIGIRENFFTGNNVISDIVYPHGKGYIAQTVVQNPAETLTYELTGELDSEFNFLKITIDKKQLDEETDDYKSIGTYVFRYTKINDVSRINRPEGIKLADIETDPAQPQSNLAAQPQG